MKTISAFRFALILSTFLIMRPGYAGERSFNTSLYGTTFIENKGQVHDQHWQPRADVLFSGSNGEAVFHLKKTGVSYQFMRVDSWKEFYDYKLHKNVKYGDKATIYRLDINWLGSNNHCEVTGINAYAGYDNFYLPVCPEGAKNVRTYREVIYENVYEGIDVHYYEKNGGLKYDYLVKAGADYRQISMQVQGASQIRIDREGALTIITPMGTIVEPKPVVTQEGRVLKAGWVLKNNVLSFDISEIDRSKPFVIDPIVRAWGTFYGNSSGNAASRVYGTSADANGDVYFTGSTENSGTLIATSGSHQSTYGLGGDAFLAKFNTNGQRLWGTYYGGNSFDMANACAIDPNGDIYIAGSTSSSGNAPGNGIATVGSHQPVIQTQFTSAFLAKFDALGNRIWGTYYSGTVNELGMSCCTDINGNVYLVGQAESSSGIATPGSYQPFLSGPNDCFIAKFNSAGVSLWATYLGGPSTFGTEIALTCASDPSGNVYVGGNISQNTVLPGGGFQNTFIGGENDGFLIKFDGNGNPLWSTYYGVPLFSGIDAVNACVTDANGDVYIAGATHSAASFTSAVPSPSTWPSTLIATPGTHMSTAPGTLFDSYLVKFNSAGVRQWGTYVGNDMRSVACAVNGQGECVVGSIAIRSVNITTPGSQQPVYGGSVDGYITKFSATGSLQYASYYGGDKEDDILNCTFDPAGNFYIAGWSASNGGTSISSLGSYQTNWPANPLIGSFSGFLVKFSDCEELSLSNTKSDVSCAGHNDGQIVINATANGSPITYSWAPVSSTTHSVGGLSAGIYTCIVTTTCGVISGQTVAVIDPPPITLSVTASSQTLCAGKVSTLTANGGGGTGALTYSWVNGAVPVSANVATINPSSTTLYSLTVTDANGCNLTGGIILEVLSCVSISENNVADEGYHLYPNPTSSQLHINAGAKCFIRICNALGQEIILRELEAGTSTFSLEQQPKGIYLVQIYGTKGMKTVRVVKE